MDRDEGGDNSRDTNGFNPRIQEPDDNLRGKVIFQIGGVLLREDVASNRKGTVVSQLSRLPEGLPFRGSSDCDQDQKSDRRHGKAHPHVNRTACCDYLHDPTYANIHVSTTQCSTPRRRILWPVGARGPSGTLISPICVGGKWRHHPLLRYMLLV